MNTFSIFMLFSYCLLAGSLVTGIHGETMQHAEGQWSRELISLADKWNITENGFSYDELSFSLDYNMSDFIRDNMMVAELFTADCKEGGVTVPSSDLSVMLVPDATEPGVGENIRGASVKIDVNPLTISSSPVYSENTTPGGLVVATVRFCMRFGLYTNGDSPIEVNFLETLVTLTVDLTDGFAIETLNVSPKDELVRTASQAYEVDGFQCNTSNEPLSDSDRAAARKQGEIIRVCVRPNQAAQDDQIFMRYIESFEFQRDYGGQIGIISQPAVEEREPASNLLTELYCIPGSSVCAFETILFASMYRTPGAVTGFGVASMQFGNENNSRRKLRQSSRATQEDEAVAAVAEFGLDFELVPVYNPYLQYGDSGGVTASLCSRRVSVGVSISLFLLYCLY
jgi:hypothetical protein